MDIQDGNNTKKKSLVFGSGMETVVEAVRQDMDRLCLSDPERLSKQTRGTSLAKINNDNNVLFSEISSRFYKSDIQEVMIGELEDPTRKHGKQVRTQGQRTSAIGFIGFSSDGKGNNFIRMVPGESENDRKVVDNFSTCDPTNHGTSRFTSDLARNRCVNMMQRKTPSVEKMQVKITFRHVVDMEERNLQKQGGLAKLLINQTQMVPLDRIFTHRERRTITSP